MHRRLSPTAQQLRDHRSRRERTWSCATSWNARIDRTAGLQVHGGRQLAGGQRPSSRHERRGGGHDHHDPAAGLCHDHQAGHGDLADRSVDPIKDDNGKIHKSTQSEIDKRGIRCTGATRHPDLQLNPGDKVSATIVTEGAPESLQRSPWTRGSRPSRRQQSLDRHRSPNRPLPKRRPRNRPQNRRRTGRGTGA